MVVQPRGFVLDAEFFGGFDLMTTLKANIFSQPLDKAEQDKFTQFILGRAERHPKLVGSYLVAGLEHVSIEEEWYPQRESNSCLCRERALS